MVFDEKPVIMIIFSRIKHFIKNKELFPKLKAGDHKIIYIYLIQ